MIDVIIPAYNASKTLGRALASLAAQSDRDFRTLVVDDCSEWEEHCAMSRTVARYSNELKDVQMLSTPQNVGAGMARQFGIEHTSGEWITFLDADDVLMPYAIEAFKVIVGGNPDTNVIHSSFYKQYKDGDDIQLVIMDRGYTWMHGKLYRRSFIEEYGIKNDPRFSRWADDSYFNAQCSELTPLTMNELPMAMYMDTADSMTSKEADAGRSKLMTLMQAMYYAGMHTLEYKDTIGHLHNTVENIANLVAQSGQTLDAEEQTWFDQLERMYEEHGVKPTPQPKPKRIRRGRRAK